MKLIKVYIDLPYKKSREFTRKIRKSIETYIENDEDGIFKDIQRYAVSFIDGGDAVKSSEKYYTWVNMVFDCEIAETEEENQKFIALKTEIELEIYKKLNSLLYILEEDTEILKGLEDAQEGLVEEYTGHLNAEETENG